LSGQDAAASLSSDRFALFARVATLLTALDVSLSMLVLLAAVPTAIAAWALLAPPHLLSREMTWDLLFNLAGAWHLHFGHVPHVDFHEPVGQLNFLLTEAGFLLVGPTPRAFLAGVALVTLAIFVTSTFVAWRRLPLLPAAIFVVFACLLVLMPANVGDHPNVYSFAMSYNRYGWSAFAVLALILFLPPHDHRARRDNAEMVIAAGLLVAMFYLKVTYFVVGAAALGVALVVCPHVRARWKGWAACALLAALLPVLPSNWPYIADLMAAAGAGGVRNSLANHLVNFLANAAEYAPYAAAFAIALWMWRHGTAPFRLPVATGFLLVTAALLLSQNTQAHGLPAAVVVAFLFYDVLRNRKVRRRPGGSLSMLASLLVFPLLAIATSAASLGGYFAKTADTTLRVVDSTNLHGLAVPLDKHGSVLAAFANGGSQYRLLNLARSVKTRFELSAAEYVETLLEAAAMLVDDQCSIVLLDQVNPLPFMLGLAPPRGGNLWSGAGAPVQPAEQVFAGADCVLIPKFSTYSPWTEAAVVAYAPYLARQFRYGEESQSWFLLRRHAQTAAPPDRIPLDEPISAIRAYSSPASP
jgi:hypothetical protein